MMKKQAMRGTIFRLARQIGAEIHRMGDYGLEFACATGALRLTAKRRVRLSDDQRAAYQERGRRLTSARRSARGKTALLEASRTGHSLSASSYRTGEQEEQRASPRAPL